MLEDELLLELLLDEDELLLDLLLDEDELLPELLRVEDELLEGALLEEFLLVEDELLDGVLLVEPLLVEVELLDGAVFTALILVDEVVEVFVGFIIEVNLLLEVTLAALLLEELSLVVLTFLLETVEEFLVLILSLE